MRQLLQELLSLSRQVGHLHRLLPLNITPTFCCIISGLPAVRTVKLAFICMGPTHLQSMTDEAPVPSMPNPFGFKNLRKPCPSVLLTLICHSLISPPLRSPPLPPTHFRANSLASSEKMAE